MREYKHPYKPVPNRKTKYFFVSDSRKQLNGYLLKETSKVITGKNPLA